MEKRNCSQPRMENQPRLLKMSPAWTAEAVRKGIYDSVAVSSRSEYALSEVMYARDWSRSSMDHCKIEQCIAWSEIQ